MEIVDRMEAGMDATLTTGATLERTPPQLVSFLASARQALRRFQRLIVDGSDHPCWTAPELTPRIDRRLLSSSATGSRISS